MGGSLLVGAAVPSCVESPVTNCCYFPGLTGGYVDHSFVLIIWSGQHSVIANSLILKHV